MLLVALCQNPVASLVLPHSRTGTVMLMEECSHFNHVTKNAPPALLRYDHTLDAD